MLDDERIPDEKGGAVWSSPAAELSSYLTLVAAFCPKNGLTFGDDIAASASDGAASPWTAVDLRSLSSDRTRTGEEPEDSHWGAGFQLVMVSKPLWSNRNGQDPQVAISTFPRNVE